MKLVLTILLLCCAQVAVAGVRLLDLERFDLEYYKIKDFRDDYSPYAQPGKTGEAWVDGAATDFDLTMAAWDEYRVYWNNRVHMEDTKDQVRHVGWQWEAGVDLDKINVFWFHHSQHILDDKVDDKFPLINTYGARVIFYQRAN